MKSGLLETLLNILFLSSLKCVLGSVVRKSSFYYAYSYTWWQAESICRDHWEMGDWALLTQQNEVDSMDIKDTTSLPKWIGQKKWQNLGNHTHWYNYTTEKCAYISSTSERILLFTYCSWPHYFYCYDDKSQSPVTFVPLARSWASAKAYCKKHYKDLVTLEDDIQLEDLPNDDLFYIWTGIHRTGPDGDWKSSTGNPIYENWAGGQPTEDGDCVAISNTDKKMTNLDCNSLFPIYCFTDNLVLVKENKTWEEALEHCRTMELAYPSLQYFNNHRNDLISISDNLDQHNVWSSIEGATTNEVWTGLRYLAHKWFWVDGTDVPYQDLPHCPGLGQYCGTLDRDNGTIPWNIRNCNEKRNFLCYRK